MRFLSIFAISALLSAPVFAADLGTYRPGTPYSSTVAAGADVCESHCAGDAQCRGWNYVKPNPRVSGVCEFLSSVSTPIASQISISGEGVGMTSLSSRVSSGGTNTVRVGTQVQPSTRTVTVGQPSTTRRVVREAVPQRAAPQSASTRRPENMSLTEQQNRYRQSAAQPRPQPAPAFRPILDGAAQPSVQPRIQPRPRPQMAAIPQQRRMTGPRRAMPPQAQPQAPQPRQATMNHPPIGQPILAPTNMPRRSVMAPQSAPTVQPANPIALSPEQASRSLFGRLNDDVAPRRPVQPNPANVPTDMPVATSVPTTPVTSEPMETLAGGR